jgi:DNA-binding MarR family transcriptional regulator
MSNTTRIVDKLIEKDLVVRKQCAENRRKIDLFITSQGLSLLNTLDSIIDEKEKEITHGIQTAEINQLLATYRKIQSKY